MWTCLRCVQEGLGSDTVACEFQVPIQQLGTLRQVSYTETLLIGIKRIFASASWCYWEADCDKAWEALGWSQDMGICLWEWPCSPSGTRTVYTGDGREMTTQPWFDTQKSRLILLSISWIAQAKCAHPEKVGWVSAEGIFCCKIPGRARSCSM